MADRQPYGRYGDDMDLPPGKTCADCVHCRRCTLIFGHIPEDERCDWAPSRFRALPDGLPSIAPPAPLGEVGG